MSDHDLIRRGDARDILSEEGWLGRSLERIKALHAVTVGVKPLVFTEARNKMWNAQHGYHIGWNHDDRYRVKLVDRVICKSIKGFDAAVDWANKHNEARILAALETVTQPAPTAQLDAGDVREAARAMIDAMDDYWRGTWMHDDASHKWSENIEPAKARLAALLTEKPHDRA